MMSFDVEIDIRYNNVPMHATAPFFNNGKVWEYLSNYYLAMSKLQQEFWTVIL